MSPEIDSSSLSVTQMEDHFGRWSTLGHTENILSNSIPNSIIFTISFCDARVFKITHLP